jgi:signal transduction histidine kinase
VRAFLPAAVTERVLGTLDEVLLTGAPAQLEIEVPTALGTRDHELRLRALGATEAVFLVRDISERREFERLQAHFVATVSHELRTPLTSIYGALRLMHAGALGALDAETHALVGVAQANTERLMRLVNDLLDIERAASGKLTLALALHDLGPLVGEAIAAARPLAAELESDYDWQAPSEACLALVDPLRVQQIVTNLLSNGVKYGSAGGRVRVRLLPEPQHWRIEVENNGEPIPVAFRPRLFERFAMADLSDSRRRGGSGLGLAISRALVESMHGSLDFSSDAQRTCFFVRLPRAEAPRP